MKLTTRLALLGMPIILQSIYLPVNRLSQGGWEPKTPLDDYIPIWPAFALPYLATIAYWCFFHLWAAVEMDEKLYKAFIISSPLAIAIGISCFILFPTYVERPPVTQEGFAWEMLRFVYKNDNVYNALPSGHAYISAVITYYFMRWKPTLNPVWIGTLIIVLISALVTRQHYWLDLAAGLVVAAIAITIGQLTVQGSQKVTTGRRQYSKTTS